MSYVDDIIFTGGMLILIACGVFHRGLRHAYDRWVEHRDHVAHVKHQQFEYVAMIERIDRMAANYAPEKRQNSHADH